MDFNNVRKKLKRKIIYWVLSPYLFVKKFTVRWYYGNKIKLLLKQNDARIKKESNRGDKNKIFLAASFRINSQARQDILRVSASLSLKNLSRQPTKVKILDASPEEYITGNKQIFSEIQSLQIDYEASELKLPPAVYKLLEAGREKYFLMFFDDQPIVGLTPEFFESSRRLLDDFKGLVDIIYISDVPKQIIDHKAKQLIYNMSDLDFVARGVKPLGIVSYGDYSYAIIPNAYIGFFFNTLIAGTEDYQDRLKWYLKNVSHDNPNLIEISGSEFRGPTYHHLAVPLSVFQINIDFSHTENSIRNYSTAVYNEVKEVFEALKNNYQIVIKN